jgi:hypothetical protein
MKEAIVRTWSKERLKEEISLISDRIDSLNHCSMHDAISQSILIGELNRREHKTLRNVTDKERHSMTLRQINIIHLGPKLAGERI